MTAALALEHDEAATGAHEEAPSPQAVTVRFDPPNQHPWASYRRNPQPVAAPSSHRARPSGTLRRDMPRTEWPRVAQLLHSAHACIVDGRLFLRGQVATQVKLIGLGINQIGIDEVTARTTELGIPVVDRVTDRPFMTSRGEIFERAYVDDHVHGRVQRTQVLSLYPKVPSKAPPMPPWNEAAFEKREDALVFAACVHALAAPLAVSNLGIVSVFGREKTARALIDIVSVVATGGEAPRSILLGDFDDGDGDDADDEVAKILGPDELLGLCVVTDAKDVVRAHPTCPIFTINVPREDIDPSATVHEIRLRRDLWLDHEEVELAHASHETLYPELLSRVRDAGAPRSFSALLQYLRRTMPSA
jgi:hypothetical protein